MSEQISSSVDAGHVQLINRNEIIERLHELGYEATNFDLQTIDYAMRAVILKVLNYCNLTELPAELKYEVIDAICADFLQGKLAFGGIPDIDGMAKKITEGDVSIEFEASPETKVSTYLESISLNFNNLLRFRKMAW